MSDAPRDPFRQDSPFGEVNPFSDNPYASPQMPADSGAGVMGAYGAAAGRSMVNHVTIVAILMIVQGALETVMGVLLVGMGVAMPFLIRMQPGAMKEAPPGFSPDTMSWLILAMYGGMGVVTVSAAGLHIFAGIRNYQFRNRTLGLVALAGGMATVLTCYCAPTAVGLGVYGLITYLNAPVAQAFAMGAAGHKRNEILAAFGQ